ncbi:MAG: hypothetical protein OER90_14485 [Gemmatimonadota bacterium]|nr:hypothetical protein [Gemmatimonadota bacterium]
MFTMRSLLSLSILFAVVPAFAAAQSLEKRHQIALRFGVWNQLTDARTEVGSGGVSTTVGSTGILGGVAYGHWFKEHLALQISVSGMAARVETQVSAGGVSTKTAVVAPLLVGMKYYFPRSTYGSSIRPFGGASVGAFVGNQLETETGSVVTVVARTATAVGGELSGGADFLLSRHFMVSLALGINLMTDFNEPIGGSKNYSGPHVMLNVSLLLGG